MEPSQTREITPVDNGCTNGCNAPFGVRCSVCNTEKRHPTAAIMDQLVVDE